ncbi:methyltransferase domain-containing protein [Nocardioides sp. YIM 152588]|uniref:methyltransferase domain-containing protein n=1 Tax=Nocardioides sp. YIM 152588 TaxID=3158259 RepID=UPI0032E3F732
MTAHRWDPARYLVHADERARPFLDLVARIDAAAPDAVVDLGCGPGTLTALLASRWPGADVVGIDSSAEMIERARAEAPELAFEVADLRDWLAEPEERADVLVSNATLQWVPGHLDLMPALVGAVHPGGWLAFQVPGNMAAPSHALLDALADEEPYAAHTRGVARVAAHDAVTYLRALTALGCTVGAWETIYLHVLRGPDPVFSWVSGTGARPTLQALPDDLRPGFEEEYRARLRAAYPAEPDGSVVLPFRRVFAVARTPA